jgi:hypothetical protein
MDEQTDSGRPWGLCPQTPGIYRIVAKGKWQVPDWNFSSGCSPPFLTEAQLPPSDTGR